MQVFVKRSVYNSIMKSLQDSKLEKLKAEVISILKRKEKENGGDAELKKAIAYFSKDEAHYSYLEKSASGEWIEKAGYGVGTVRIWKGKKYKKVSSSPVRWVRVFDKHDRGAATSMGKYIAQVKKCNSVEELYQFCMRQRSLFQDENGVDLPIMDKLKAAIDEQSGKLEQGGKVKAQMKEYQKEDLAKLKAGNYSFDSFDDFKAEIKKQSGNVKGAKQPNYIGYLSQYNDNYLQQVYDAMPKAEKNTAEENYIKNSGNKKLKDKVKAAIKKYGVTGQNLMNVLYSKDKELYNELDKMGADNAKQFIMQTNADNRDSKSDDSKVLSNGKTVKEVREQYGIKTDKKETENEYFDKEYEYYKNNLSKDDDLKTIKNDLEKEKRNAEKKNDRKRLLSAKAKEKVIEELESEAEKHQNRSDAMKGNKNAYKGKAEEIANKRILAKEDMLNKPLTTIQKYANADVYDMNKFKTIDEALEDSFNTYKGSIDLGEVTKDELAERVGKEWAKKQNHDVAREIFKDYDAGKLTVNDDGILENKKETNTSSNPYVHKKIGSAVEKYATDKQIKSTVNKISDEDFSSTDENRASLNGVFHEDGYNIATDGRILSMIKADYPSEDEGKTTSNKTYKKTMEKKLKNLNKILIERENGLKELGEKEGTGTNTYRMYAERVSEVKNEIKETENSLNSGYAHGQFPNYKKVIPSVAGNDVEPAKGFDDFNKILKIAKVAAAYKKDHKREGISVKVGDYNFNPDMLLNAVAMAEKHGLKNVNFRPNSYNPAQSPVEFSGDNGYIVIMPTGEDTYVFNADTGDVSSKYATEYTKDEELEKFLSGASTKENVKKALFDLIDMLDESEDEETDYTDYDASQPELFNTIQEDVSAAFAEVYGY